MENKFYKRLPESPGVYLMRGRNGRILYIGKAANLKRRLSSYFRGLNSCEANLTPFMRAEETRIEKLLKEIKKVDYIKTDTALEALILEAKLIKKYKPFYNIKEKDDKSFLFIEITKEKFPRVLLVRGKTKTSGERFGPFTSASSVRQGMRIIRRIFPWSIHPQEKPNRLKRGCFDYQIGLCPGTCLGVVNRRHYLKNIRNIRLLLKGKKSAILRTLKKDMARTSKKLEFEQAEKLRRQILSLEHIQDVSLITDSPIYDSFKESATRWEGYDISNISGTSAVGSMAVFVNAKPVKSEYRKFKIRTVIKSDDVGMIKEVLVRRLNNVWSLPGLILIDGGKPQVNAVKSVLEEFGLKIPVLGIAKGPRRGKNEFIGEMPSNIDKKDLIWLRDESHRFALEYHKKLRSLRFKE